MDDIVTQNKDTNPEDKPSKISSPLTKRLLLIEKGLFIAAATCFEFFLTLQYAHMQWIASKYIPLYLVPPFVLAGFIVRRKRKKEIKKLTSDLS